VAKWGYLARAYAIKEYAYMRATQAENGEILNGRTEAEADTLPEVIEDIEAILEMAEDCDDKATAKQCRKFLLDFKEQKGR